MTAALHAQPTQKVVLEVPLCVKIPWTPPKWVATASQDRHAHVNPSVSQPVDKAHCLDLQPDNAWLELAVTPRKAEEISLDPMSPRIPIWHVFVRKWL